jgi:hypothetical protein
MEEMPFGAEEIVADQRFKDYTGFCDVYHKNYILAKKMQ